MGTALPGPLHLAHNHGWAQPWPQVPRSSLGTLLMRGRENCWEVWPGENVRSSGGRTGFRFPGHVPREPGNLAWLLKGGACCPEGGLWWRGPGAHARFRVWARNWPVPARTKAISWGRPPCSSISNGGSLYGWKNRGIFGVVVTGRWCLRVCLHVGRLLAPPPHVSEHLGGTGPLISGCRCPAVVKEWRGHSTGERGHLDHERAPGKFPSPGHQGSRCFPRLLPWGLILLNWARVGRM